MQEDRPMIFTKDFLPQEVEITFEVWVECNELVIFPFIL